MTAAGGRASGKERLPMVLFESLREFGPYT